MEKEFEYINAKIDENISLIAKYQAKELFGDLDFSDQTILKMAQDELKVLQSIWSHIKFRKLYNETI